MDAKSQFRFSKAEYSKSNRNMVVITSWMWGYGANMTRCLERVYAEICLTFNC